jgi:hypothetical protein
LAGSLGPLDCCTPVPVEAALKLSDSRLAERELAKSRSSKFLDTPLWAPGDDRPRSARGMPVDRATFLRPAGVIPPSTTFVHSATAADAAARKLATSAEHQPRDGRQSRLLGQPGLRNATHVKGKSELGGLTERKCALCTGNGRCHILVGLLRQTRQRAP